MVKLNIHLLGEKRRLKNKRIVSYNETNGKAGRGKEKKERIWKKNKMWI